MNIAAVWADGTVKIYNHHNRCIKIKKFNNYGQALDFAREYEANQQQKFSK